MIPSDRGPIVSISGEQCSPVCAPQWSIHPCFQPLVTTLSVAATWTGRPLWSYIVHVGFVGHGWFMTLLLCRVMTCSKAWRLGTLLLNQSFYSFYDISYSVFKSTTEYIKINHEWNVLESKSKKPYLSFTPRNLNLIANLKFYHLFLESQCCTTAPYTLVCIVKFCRGLKLYRTRNCCSEHTRIHLLCKNKTLLFERLILRRLTIFLQCLLENKQIFQSFGSGCDGSWLLNM